MEAERFETVKTTKSPPIPSITKRVCNRCEQIVITEETTGTCPDCGQEAVFTEPENELPDGLSIVDRYAGQPVVVDTTKPHEGAAVEGGLNATASDTDTTD